MVRVPVQFTILATGSGYAAEFRLFRSQVSYTGSFTEGPWWCPCHPLTRMPSSWVEVISCHSTSTFCGIRMSQKWICAGPHVLGEFTERREIWEREWVKGKNWEQEEGCVEKARGKSKGAPWIGPSQNLIWIIGGHRRSFWGGDWGLSSPQTLGHGRFLKKNLSTDLLAVFERLSA